MKRCNKCGEEKELTTEYWRRDKSKKDGYRSSCKECQKIMDSEYRAKNKEKIARYKEQYAKDNKEKIARYKEQYYEKNKEKLLRYQEQHYEDNKEAKLEHQKQYRKDNKEKIARYRKHNKEKLARYREQYYKENKEKLAEQQKEYRAKNKEKIAEYRKQYYQSEQGRKNIAKSNQNRRARKAQLPNTLTIEQYNENLDHFDYKCAYCECELTPDNHHMEHVHPISRGVYGTTKENCIPSCVSCNLSKGVKTLAEWYVWTEHYSFKRLLKIHEITSGGKKWVINQKEHTNKWPISKITTQSYYKT